MIFFSCRGTLQRLITSFMHYERGLHQTYGRAHNAGRCYKLFTKAQALINLDFCLTSRRWSQKAGSGCCGVGKRLYPPVHEQTLFLLKNYPMVRKVAHRGEKRCRGIPVGAPRLLEGDWFSSFSAAQPTAPCQRKNVLLVSRMGSGHRFYSQSCC